MFLVWYGNGLFPNFRLIIFPAVTRMSKNPSALVSVKPSLRLKPLETLTPLSPWPLGVNTLPLTTDTRLG